MKSFLKFLAVTAVVVLLSCVLAPILFKILPFKFEKIFNRLIMIFTLVSAALFVRLDLKKIASYGFSLQARWKGQLALGFAGGLLTLVLLTFLKLAAGNAAWDLESLSAGRWIYKLLSVFFTAFLIGTIEEVFFRGIVFQSLADKFKGRIFWAVLLTSLFYSLVHFVNVKKPFIGPDPGIMDSFKLLAAPFMSFLRWQEYWRGAVGLFIFGVVLNGLKIQTRSLLIPIGLHAGCVFYLKLARLFVEFSNNQPLLWGSAKMYDCLAGWAALALMGWGLSAAARVAFRNENLQLKAKA